MKTFLKAVIVTSGVLFTLCLTGLVLMFLGVVSLNAAIEGNKERREERERINNEAVEQVLDSLEEADPFIVR